MNLSEKEIEYLRSLKSTEQTFYRLRYVFLTLGVICIVISLGGYLFFLTSQDSATFEKFRSHPMFYLLGIAGGLGIGMAVRGWKGNAAHRLIIKVVEELKDDNPKK
jgi:hypothetical protein